MWAGGNDTGSYRTAQFGGRSVPLDVGDVSISYFNAPQDRQRYTARLGAVKLPLDVMQQRELAPGAPVR